MRKQYCSNLIVSRSEFTGNVCKYNANQTIFDKDWLDWSKWTIRVNPDAVFLRAFKTQESYDCSMKIDKVYLKGQYGSNCIVPRYKFIKNISRSQKKAFHGTLRGYLREQYCSNLIVYQSEFTENVCKYKANQTIFDKDWLSWSKLTIRVNPYCPWLLIARDIVN